MENVYRLVFDFDKKTSGFMKRMMQKEFLYLRQKAVKEINPRIKGWNEEFNGESIDYDKFMSKKQNEVLKEINKKYFTWFTKIESDDECDLIAVNKFDKNLVMHMGLVPYEG